MKFSQDCFVDKHFKCISINGFSGDRTAYGMQVCHSFAKTLSEYLNVQVEFHGEPQATANLSWNEALTKSNGILAKASSLIKFAFDEGIKPIIITPRCATAIATLPQVMNKFPECVVIYFDAHGDVTTPTTTVSGYLGGMPITAAMGVWNSGFGSGVKASQFVHIGGRDFDSCEIEFLEEKNILVLSKKQVEQDLLELERLIKNKPVFIHIDVDVFDPSEVVAEYAVANGLLRHHIQKVMATVLASGVLVGLEITEFSPKTDKERESSYDALFDSLQSLRL